MPLNSLFVDLAARLRSAEFLFDAVHPDHPTAFTRQRKLPLPTLVALMLSGMRKSIQGELDEFFAHLNNQAQLVRKVSEQAFAQARSKLSLTAIPLLNDWVIGRADHYGFVSCWRIEEAFKRLKHRLNLEHVSGLSQQAVGQDVAARMLSDNLQALTTLSAHENAELTESVHINRAYVHTALKPLLPALLLGKMAAKLLRNVLRLVTQHTYVHRENLSKPRKPGPKPRKYLTQKHC